MCKIQETLLREGWLPINDYKVAWVKNGSVFYLCDETVDLIDAIAIENHSVGFEKGAYEQQQQEDVEAAPKVDETLAEGDGSNGIYIGYLMGNSYHSWVERVKIAKRERTHSDYILDMMETCTKMHANAVEHKCFGAAVSIAAVLSSFHEDLREVLRDERLTSGSDL